jgi:hypothetical protein
MFQQWTGETVTAEARPFFDGYTLDRPGAHGERKATPDPLVGERTILQSSRRQSAMDLSQRRWYHLQGA